MKIFGTDGIRDIVNHGFLRPSFLDKLGRVIGADICSGHKSPKAIIGRDTRPSGKSIEKILFNALASSAVAVDRAGIISTPGLAYLAKCGKYSVGIMISASHNPVEYNGIKLFASNGLKINASIEERMEDRLLDASLPKMSTSGTHPPPAGEPRPNGGPPAKERDGLAVLRHSKSPASERRLAARYFADIPKIVLGAETDILSPGFRIVLDCANGALSDIAPDMFSRTGATVIAINRQSDGKNINCRCGSLHPEALRKKVLSAKAHVGFSFDGDGDRVIMADEKGNIRDGDFVLYIAAGFLKKRRLLKRNTVVGTIMTNSALENTFAGQGIKLVRTPVGDKYVLDEMLKKGFSIGGEPSGHIIFADYSKNGDGVITALVMLRIMAEENKTLGQLSKGFSRYPQIIVNVPVSAKPPLEEIVPIKQAEDEIHDILRGRGRLVLRYSGTENLCRIMIEGKSLPYVKSLANKLAGVIKKSLG
ncbi:MAG: phosphoglucosamine mutase [Planctomycetota bacterium]